MDDFLASQVGSDGAAEELARRVMGYVEDANLDPDSVEISLGNEGDVQVAIPTENRIATFSLGLSRFSEESLDQVRASESLSQAITLAQKNAKLHAALDEVTRLDIQNAPSEKLVEALRKLDDLLSALDKSGNEDFMTLADQIRSLRDNPDYAKGSGLHDRFSGVVSKERSLNNEKTLKGLKITISNLKDLLKGIEPAPATPAEGDGVRIETLVLEMYEAKIYSAFIQLREKGMTEKRAITLDDLEKLLNENSVTDLGVRLRFCQLALKYFERVKKIEEKSKQLQEVTQEGKIASKSVQAFIQKEFGIEPKGKVEFVVRDIHIATIFHDDEDYIKASSPHNDLWQQDPKDYDEEEKAIYKGIRDHALEAGGMSFGEGLTIQRSYGKGEDKKILEHEEGHELVSIGPCFFPRENPWKIQGQTSGDIDTLLESVFWKEGIRSLHNEMTSYFREPGEFCKSNLFYEGSKLYDPKVTRNLREVLWEKVGRDADRFKEAEAKLNHVHHQFFERVHQTYKKLSEIALRFEKNPELAEKYKPRIIAWLSIRGDRPWNADLLKYIEYDQEIQNQPKPQIPEPKVVPTRKETKQEEAGLVIDLDL